MLAWISRRHVAVSGERSAGDRSAASAFISWSQLSREVSQRGRSHDRYQQGIMKQSGNCKGRQNKSCCWMNIVWLHNGEISVWREKQHEVTLQLLSGPTLSISLFLNLFGLLLHQDFLKRSFLLRCFRRLTTERSCVASCVTNFSLELSHQMHASQKIIFF